MIKKIISWVIFASTVGLLVTIFVMKDSMNTYMASMIKDQVSFENVIVHQENINVLYNYEENGIGFSVTFLEFGAMNCVACKRMETVMAEIKSKYPDDVNVVFMNILVPEYQNLMKYYGVSTIPTQILLDKSGNEFFRNTGFCSTMELSSKISKQIAL